MAVRETLRCVLCSHDRPMVAFGLTPRGAFDPVNAYQNEMSLRRDTIGGRGRLSVERVSVPLPIALGIRDMLRYRLAQVNAEIRAAGVELDDD